MSEAGKPVGVAVPTTAARTAAAAAAAVRDAPINRTCSLPFAASKPFGCVGPRKFAFIYSLLLMVCHRQSDAGVVVGLIKILAGYPNLNVTARFN